MPVNPVSDSVISISKVISDNNTQRLNYIAGRSLSQQEFDLMQLYVDERCEDLLQTREPGIVYGLEIITPLTKAEFADTSIRINPGLGVSRSGKAVTNRLPLNFHWNDLLENYRKEKDIIGKIQNGYYFLTLRRRVTILDTLLKTDPCTRTESDPLRDTRLETLAQVNLQFIPAALSLMGASRQRVAIHILKKKLSAKFVAENEDEVELALVKIIDNDPQWIDSKAGRFLASEDAAHLTLMNYWHHILAAPSRFRLDGDGAPIDDSQTLQDLLDIECLPAAGRFPESLIDNLAGRVSPTDFKLWERPLLKFDPDGLQIEILPVPANAVNGIIRKELTRGTVDLSNGEMDRIRIMVAVNPDDYHPKLMDLPEIDVKLIQSDLVKAQDLAYKTYKAWAEAYWELYFNLESSVARDDKDNLNPSAKTSNIFSSIYLTSIPKNAFKQLQGDRDFRKKISIPDFTDAPATITAELDSLQLIRRDELFGRNSSRPLEELPRPWSLRSTIVLNEPHREAIGEPSTDDVGFIQKRINTREDIEKLEDFIVRLNQLIDEVRDQLSVQRQQLDSITVSFASLAGGIPGDGTGLKLMRWSDKLTFSANLVKKGS